ncbi:MAG: alpha/beta fold hydrolase [Rhizobiaceae bacterium]|nr:alpha/beta fold hydrolase [Rhizobiaceae bacterium]
MPIAENGDVEVFYEVTGSGPPLVLIMGLGADHSVWELHREAYARHFQCIAIDNRGVGKTSKPVGSYTTADMARDVLAVMDDAGVQRAHVAGISMGGAIAQQVCLQAPERVRSLVLISTWGRLPSFHRTVFEHFKSVRAHTNPGDFMRCLQLWIWGPAYFEKNGTDLETARRDASQNPAPQPQYAFEAQCDACISHDTLERLGEVKVPTLVTIGLEDIFTPFELSQALHNAIAGSELLRFPGCAHTHHWEDLDKFNSATLLFMQRH